VDAATFDRALAIVMHRKLVGHEAAHASAALVLDLPVREVVVNQNDLSAPPEDPTEPAGFARIGRPDSTEGTRKVAIAIMGGRLEDGTARWPPKWPLTLVPEYGDEADLCELVEALELDKAGYSQLVTDAYDVCASPEFNRLHIAVSHALEQHGRLDELTLERIKAIVIEGATVQHTTKSATVTATEQGEFTAIAAAYSIDRVKDQIIPGAFAGTIARWRASGKRMPLHWNHQGKPPT
jgi:hypothetical protein